MSGALSFRRKVLLAFTLLVVGTIAPAAWLADRWLTDELRERARRSLEREVTLIAADLRGRDEPPLEIVRRLGEGAGARLTLLDGAGVTLADSEAGDEPAQRLEVTRAIAGAIGSDVRRSSDGEETLYVAAPALSPSARVVRLALPLAPLRRTGALVGSALLSAGLVALAIAAILIVTLSRWLLRPLLPMTDAARRMAGGDFAVPLPRPSRDEVGDLARALTALRDEHAARLAELSRERNNLRTILGGMTEGVALVEDARIAVANPAFAQLLGATSPVEGRRPLEAARLPELHAALAEVRAGRSASLEAHAGGRVLRVRAQPLGEGGAAVVVLVDTTEERRLERLRREFVANASHELRTPVAAIAGAAETLAAGAADDPAARAAFVAILLRHADRLRRLTADLLDLSRLEAGHRPSAVPVPVAEAAAVAISTVRERADAKRLTVEAAVPLEVRARADRAALEQILTNLIENAVKYTARGRIDVSARSDDEWVEIAVADSGPGIPADHLPRLFERFYRVDDARSRELGGTGLGLAIVKHLAMANGGSVSVESEVGRGSRFLVRLPRA